MAIWKLTNDHKKNVVERQFWVKDGLTVVKDECYRWGVFSTESEERPEVDLDNPDGWEQFGQEQDWDMEEMMDGCWIEWTWPDDMDEEERQRVEELWNEDSFEAMENDGWYNDDTEHWVYGPLRLTNEETGEEFVGKDPY